MWPQSVGFRANEAHPDEKGLYQLLKETVVPEELCCDVGIFQLLMETRNILCLVFISETDLINTEETTGTSSHTKICLLKKILGVFLEQNYGKIRNYVSYCRS